MEYKECKICLNNTNNPTISINNDGLCRICELYQKNFDPEKLKQELEFLKSFKKVGERYDVMVGLSGGKDSTAMLKTILDMGLKPLAFTFDIGYYPEHIIGRAKKVAEKLGVDHEVIDIRKYITEEDKESYKKTAELYDKQFSPELKKEFLKNYIEGKKHYSVKSTGTHAFVRTCRLCRHAVIKAYYEEAKKRGVGAIILGINEWAGLSQTKDSGKFEISGVRKLQPNKNDSPVYVFHLPFILRRTIDDIKEILKPLGWEVPEGEELIETNSNSCLLARAAETKAKEMLGFHPDSTRLSREVTVGFLTKKQVAKALSEKHVSELSVEQILKKADII